MVPGARETFAAVLGEDVPKKSPALAAPPSKLKTKPPPPAVKEEKPPPPKPVEKAAPKSVEKPVEPTKPPMQPLLAMPPLPPPPPPPPPPPAPPSEPKIEEEVAPVKDSGEAQVLSLQFSLDEACNTMESIAEVAIGAGESHVCYNIAFLGR